MLKLPENDTLTQLLTPIISGIAFLAWGSRKAIQMFKADKLANIQTDVNIEQLDRLREEITALNSANRNLAKKIGKLWNAEMEGLPDMTALRVHVDMLRFSDCLQAVDGKCPAVHAGGHIAEIAAKIETIWPSAIKAALTLFFIILLQGYTVSAADFHPVFINTILPHEGGYTSDKNDPGNWTGGKVGKGELHGTKYGIAANSFPKLDIKNLTVKQAESIYQRDYWDVYHLGELKSQGIADELCDEIVNGGPGLGQQLLGKVLAEIDWSDKDKIWFFQKTPPRARFTPETIAWINKYTYRRENRIAFYNSIRIHRVAFYVDLVHRKPKMRPYFLSWIGRTVE
jgi:Glycosyl hydrolase 108